MSFNLASVAIPCIKRLLERMFIIEVLFYMHVVLRYIMASSFTLKILNHFVNHQCDISAKDVSSKLVDKL